MSGPFLSDSWYRVEKLRPRLKEHLELSRHRYWGASWYVVRDPVAGKVHRFTPGAWLFIGRLDGRRTVDQAWREAAEILGEDAPSQSDVLTILGQLHSVDIVSGAATPDVSELVERQRKQSRQLAKSNLLGPLSFRIPLFNPDRFLEATVPLVRPLVGWIGLLLVLALVVPAVMLAGRHWDELTFNLSDRVLSADNLLMLAIVYPLVKIVHELAHGYVAKAYGAGVREFGIMFLVFFPVPYVDASAASSLPGKYQRAAVSAAGIIAEVSLASIAMFAWTALEPGVERAIAFNVMAIGGISTVLVNGNPLLRFDGYFIFTDLAEIPNLGNRANRFLGHLVEKYAFGVEKSHPYEATTAEKAIFLFYAPAAFIYRIVVLFGIALFISQRFFFVGVALAIWSAILSLGKPAGKGLWHVFVSARMRRDRRQAMAVTSAAIATIAGLLFLVPVPDMGFARGVVWLPESAYVRTGADGFADDVLVGPGARVEAGTPVAKMSLPALNARAEGLRWRVAEFEQRLQKARTEAAVTVQIVREELKEARAQLARTLEVMSAMTVVTAASGTFVPAVPLTDLAGSYLPKGSVIGYAVPDEARTLRIAVTQDLIERVRGRLRTVVIRPVLAGGATYETTLLREVPAAQYQLPSPALGRAAGGAIATDPRDTNGTTALNRVFQFDAALPDELADAGFGARMDVRFRFEDTPAGLQAARWFRRVLLTQLGT